MDPDGDNQLPMLFAAELEARAGASAFYIYWFAGARSRAAPSSPRERVLLAFPTPDGALAFAQRSVRVQDAERPRLRRLTLPQLIEAVVREPAITALVLVADDDHSQSPGGLPAGVRVERDEILRRARAAEPDSYSGDPSD